MSFVKIPKEWKETKLKNGWEEKTIVVNFEKKPREQRIKNPQQQKKTGWKKAEKYENFNHILFQLSILRSELKKFFFFLLDAIFIKQS